MNRPTWATVVGIIGIVFGALGLLNSANTVVLPQMIEWQKTFMHSFTANMPAQHPGDPSGKEVTDALNAMWGPMPGWFKVWCVAGGLLGLVVSSAYIFAAISMLQLKRNAVRLFYACTAVAIVLAVLRGALGLIALRLMGLSLLMGSTASVAVHVVLLLVVATANKAAFQE